MPKTSLKDLATELAARRFNFSVYTPEWINVYTSEGWVGVNPNYEWSPCNHVYCFTLKMDFRETTEGLIGLDLVAPGKENWFMLPDLPPAKLVEWRMSKERPFL